MILRSNPTKRGFLFFLFFSFFVSVFSYRSSSFVMLFVCELVTSAELRLIRLTSIVPHTPPRYVM